MHSLSQAVHLFIIPTLCLYLVSCHPLARGTHYTALEDLNEHLQKLAEHNPEDIDAVLRVWWSLRGHDAEDLTPSVSIVRPEMRKRQLHNIMSVNQDLGAIAGMLRTASHRWQQRQLQDIKAKLNRLGKRAEAEVVDESSGLLPEGMILPGILDSDHSAFYPHGEELSNWQSPPTLASEIQEMKAKSAAMFRGQLRNGGLHEKNDEESEDIEQDTHNEPDNSGSSDSASESLTDIHSKQSHRNPKTRPVKGGGHLMQGLRKRSPSRSPSLLERLVEQYRQGNEDVRRIIKSKISEITKRLVERPGASSATEQPILVQRRPISVNGPLIAISDMLSASRARQRLNAEGKLSSLG